MGLPRLTFANEQYQALLGEAYNQALRNLTEINTKTCEESIANRTGLVQGNPGNIIMAGEIYSSPWTRDAALNCWNGASLLMPETAGNTLWAVCEKDPAGKLRVRNDNQWWDKVIWLQGAWFHYLVTGDGEFLRNAYEAGCATMEELQAERYDSRFGLFRGPSFFNDGISGYPASLHQPEIKSSFVLDHPDTHSIMTLSTNCLYFRGFVCLARMGQILEESGDCKAAALYLDAAERLKEAINRHFWLPEGRYGYLLYGAGERRGQLDPSQEGAGHAFAILFGIADSRQSASIARQLHREPKGITASWPPFPGLYTQEAPGRHNGMIWPMINGLWAQAALQAGRADIFVQEAEGLASLAAGSGWNFYEVYHPVTGAIDGGIQGGKPHRSCSNQTWSATAYISILLYGMLGLRFSPQGIQLKPFLPAGWGTVQLAGLRYRQMKLGIILSGAGGRVRLCLLDGKPLDALFIPSSLAGEHEIYVELEQT